MEQVKCYPEENRDEENAQISSPSEPLPLISQNIDNPLVENVHEINNFDNAYTETFTHPNPRITYGGIELD